jgi:hypothetical protein
MSNEEGKSSFFCLKVYPQIAQITQKKRRREGKGNFRKAVF